MSFIELETWIPKKGEEEKHHEMVRTWIAFVKEHRDELFPEWKSVRYYRQQERYSGKETGRYMMIFEYYDHPRFMAYKERRKNWDGPYAAYKEVDPYQYFDMETVTESYWVPNEQSQVWVDFPDK
jgi:hypothetical protein